MKPKPSVSVVIPHYRDLDRLDLCLRALERQTYPADKFEIVVADNASPEGEAAVARVIAGRARLVVVSDRGAGPARNGGAAAAEGGILAFTDSDCVPEPQWLAEGIKALDAYDFVGGRVKVLVENAARMTAAEAFERVFAFDIKTYITKKGFTASANLLCPRTVFEEVGGFGAGLSEDVDWSRRARAAGFRLGYSVEAAVGHPARRTWDELRAKWRRVHAETYVLWSTKKARPLLWLMRSLALPASAVAHTPRVLFSRELDTLKQRLLALRMLYQIRLWRSVDALRLIAHGN